MSRDNGYLIVEASDRFGLSLPSDIKSRLEYAGLNPLALDPTAYAGMGRRPMVPLPTREASELSAWRNDGIDVDSDQAARLRFWEVIGNQHSNEDPESLLSDLGHAQEVYSLVDDQGDWQMIEVTRLPLARTDEAVGYDVGYWTDDFESLIANLFEAGHADLRSMASHIGLLNDYVLFDSAGQAEAFGRDVSSLAGWQHREEQAEARTPEQWKTDEQTPSLPESIPVRIDLHA